MFTKFLVNELFHCCSVNVHHFVQPVDRRVSGDLSWKRSSVGDGLKKLVLLLRKFKNFCCLLCLLFLQLHLSEQCCSGVYCGRASYLVREFFPGKIFCPLSLQDLLCQSLSVTRQHSKTILEPKWRQKKTFFSPLVE